MKTVVLLSGGIDSAVALAMQLDRGDVSALTIDYGQRHIREITAAEQIANYFDVDHTIVTVDPILFRGSALTGKGAVPTGVAVAPDATYVPARNTVFLALAAARAESIGAGRIVIGANADDATGYPDCRRDFIEAMRDVLQAGTIGHVWVAAPLLDKSKAQVIDLARDLDVPMHLTWSCYEGDERPCGECGACITRERAMA